jgi:hypothetical protein
MGCKGDNKSNKFRNNPNAAVLTIFLKVNNKWIGGNQESLKILEYIDKDIILKKTKLK